jgi:hypothetical protein
MLLKDLPMNPSVANLAETRVKTLQAAEVAKCLKQHVPPAVKLAKFPLSPARIVLFTVVIALQTEANIITGF